jgi:hypothetical protein
VACFRVMWLLWLPFIHWWHLGKGGVGGCTHLGLATCHVIIVVSRLTSIRPVLVYLTTRVSSLTSQPLSFVIVVACPEGTIDVPHHQHDMALGGVGVCRRQHSGCSFSDVASSWFVCTIEVVQGREGGIQALNNFFFLMPSNSFRRPMQIIRRPFSPFSAPLTSF